MKFFPVLLSVSLFSFLLIGNIYAQQPAPAAGDAYAVQVLISKTKLNPTDARFKGVKGIQEETANAVFKYKYTTGRTNSYEEATATKLKMIEAGFKDAFVVIYKDGKRVTSKQPISVPGEKPVVNSLTAKPAAVEANDGTKSKSSAPKKGLGNTVVQTEPEFPGGNDSLLSFIRQNLHPAQPGVTNGTWKAIHVGFTIDKNGKLQNAKVLDNVSEEIKTEALRFVHSMPDWKPGTIDGTPTDREYTLPLDFFIPEKE
jgi:hypothetical protein